MADKHPWPPFIQRLKELKYRVLPLGWKRRDAYKLYLVDLSDWKLRFSEQTPLIWVKAETARHLSAQELMGSLKDVAREHRWQHRDGLILLDDDRQEFRELTARQYFPRFVVIDAADQRRILEARSFTAVFQDLILDQVSLSNLAPYQIGAPVVGSRFFGREREIEKILTKHDTNFAIMGVRRIGKTSLLKEVHRRLLEQEEDASRIVWLDCSTLASPDQFVKEVVRHLYIRDLPHLERHRSYLFHLPDFLKRMYHKYGGRITFFLDEADDFLKWTHSEWNLLPVLRTSMNEGHCRYVVAGFQS